ncbi:cleavage and polyadenylation specificity factor subunit 3 [Trichinella spiralis]|uniref:cleavage and polyadenylation specificity factor subunit 3 n=1 Tax=Trichinella spiralis TaxID=6334 RepID=UPI0001EFBA11|nr:cleavage and polyadenylation specificity factor subunit 3 [Trichinella spiralis]
MCTFYVSNCNQKQVKYLRMFVMPHLEQTDVNMTNHGAQNERNLRTVQLMMLSIFMYSYSYSDRYSNLIHVTLASSSYLINQIQYLLMNDTICDKQRHTGRLGNAFTSMRTRDVCDAKI